MDVLLEIYLIICFSNRDSNFDPRAASYEITKVYMPDVWTATEGIYAPLGGDWAAEDSTSKTAAEKSQKEAPVEAPKEKEEAKSTTKATVTESSKTSEEASTKTTTTTSAPEQHISTDSTSSSSTAAAAAAATASTASNVVAEEEGEKEASTGSGGGPHFTREYLEQEVLEKVERCTVAELLKLLQGQLEVVVPKNNKSKHPRKEILISMVRERVAELIAQMESGGSSTDKTSEKAVPETTTETTTSTTTKAAEVVENGKGESEEKQSEVVVSNGESEEEKAVSAAEAGAEKTSSSSNKRKAEEEETAVAAEKKTSAEEATKKQKTSSEEVEVVKKVSTSSEETSSSSHPFSGVTSSLKVKGVGLSVVSLAALLTPHKHDQFELCVVAELLGDALALHFARYIHSAVLANFHLITAAKAKTAEPVEKVCFDYEVLECLKCSNSLSFLPFQPPQRSIEPNYVHLAFSYFDRAHCGLMPCEDLQALLNATGLPLSRKVYSGLVAACQATEKAVAYREFAEPQGPLVERPPVYPTVHLQGHSSISLASLAGGGASAAAAGSSVGDGSRGGGGPLVVPLMVERNGVQYNVDQLIRQAVEDQKVKVELSEQLLKVTARSGKWEWW